MFLARGTGVLPSLAFGVWEIIVVCGRVFVFFFEFLFFLWSLGFPFSSIGHPGPPLHVIPLGRCPLPLFTYSVHPRPELRPADWVGAFSASGAWELGKGLLKKTKQQKKKTIIIKGRKKKVKSLALSTHSDSGRLQGFADLNSLGMSSC